MTDFPYATSFWADPGPAERTEPLRSDERADVVVVGAGYAGLSAAYYLKQERPDLDVVVVEAEHAGFGASGRNFGCVAPDFLAEISLPLEELRAEGRFLISAREELRKRISSGGFDCEYRPEHTLYAAWDDDGWLALQRMGQQFEEQGVPNHLLSEQELGAAGGPVARGALVHTAWHMVQPYKLVRGLRASVLASGVRLYEGTPVRAVEPGSPVVVHTASGSVTAEKAVMGTNAYSERFPLLKGVVVPIHNHVMATEPLSDEQLERIGFGTCPVVLDAGIQFYYAQVYERRLLFGGGGGDIDEGPLARVSSLDQAADRDDAQYERIHAELLRRYPFLEGGRMEAVWGGPIAVTNSTRPVVRELPDAENVIVSVGFNGSGVVSANASGRMVKGLVLGERHVDDEAERVRQIWERAAEEAL